MPYIIESLIVAYWELLFGIENLATEIYVGNFFDDGHVVDCSPLGKCLGKLKACRSKK